MEELSLSPRQIASIIDYSALKPDVTKEDLKRVCREAVELGVRAVCVNSWLAPLASSLLRGTGVLVCSTVGFPMGASATEVKVREAAYAVQAGASEVDVVINIGALKSGDLAEVERDLRRVVAAAKRSGAKAVKAIIECCYLSRDEKIEACRIAASAGADFIKTSTGFGPSGADPADVRLIREVVGDRIGIKAAGGIRTLSQLLKLLEAGADVIGTSSAYQIVHEAEALSPRSR